MHNSTATPARFVVGEVAKLGGWQVTDTVTGRVQHFGTDKIGALDYSDHQNWAQARAAEFAASDEEIAADRRERSRRA